MYKEQQDYKKAEEYYLKAIESGNDKALNSLAWMYFETAKDAKSAMLYVSKSMENDRNFFNTHTMAIVMLWNEEFSLSYEMFAEWLTYGNAVDSESDVSIYLNLLIAKGQYYKAKELLEIEEYQLKERYKPIWYALMTLMQKEFPNEIKKMGSELQESVNSVLDEIDNLAKKYN